MSVLACLEGRSKLDLDRWAFRREVRVNVDPRAVAAFLALGPKKRVILHLLSS